MAWRVNVMYARQVAAAARLTRDLPRYFRWRLTPEQALARIRWRLEHRERLFLELVDRAVWANRRSPYRRLLRHIGCNAGHLRELVGREGVEGALGRLHTLGLFVTQAELKGREPIRRGSLTIAVRDTDFDNPLVKPHIYLPTSGSTGRPLQVGRSLQEWAEGAEGVALILRAHGIDRPAVASWYTAPHVIMRTLASSSGVIGWFSPVGSPPLAASIGRWYMGVLGKVAGARLAWPSAMSQGDPGVALDWLRRAIERHPSVCAYASASIAVRVSSLATERGLSLRGVAWRPGGEPLTPGRREIIAATGALVIPAYASTESGHIGDGCARPVDVDDIHVATDRFAIIQPPGSRTDRPAPLLVSGISHHTPKVLLNTEIGDSANLAHRDCGCAAGDAGLRVHVSNIGSHEKVTGQGITLLGADLIGLCDSILPARFGGRAGDYQLVERDGSASGTQLVVRIRPSVGPVHEAAVRASVLEAIAAGGSLGQYMARILADADALSVERQAPETLPSGKTPAFVPLRGST